MLGLFLQPLFQKGHPKTRLVVNHTILYTNATDQVLAMAMTIEAGGAGRTKPGGQSNQGAKRTTKIKSFW